MNAVERPLLKRQADSCVFGDVYAAERMREMLERLRAQRVICCWGSCAKYLGNIWPNYHGVILPFEIVSVWEWLWEQVPERRNAG